MIIIEGPDGTGKTTIARTLCRILRYHYVKSPGTIPADNTMTKTERMFWFKTMCKIEHVVMDRCYYISEAVYGPLFRERSSADEYEVLGFLDEFRSQPGNLILLCERFYEHNEDPKNSAHIHLDEEERRGIEKQATERRDEVFCAYWDFVDAHYSYLSSLLVRVTNPTEGIKETIERVREITRYERE